MRPSCNADMLRGRDRELAALHGLLGDIAAGRGRALVMEGPSGIGKSALLQRLGESAASVRMLRARGARDEAGLAFAALQQLCTPVLHDVEKLPPPQQQALLTAFGIREGPAPDPFLIGLGMLGMLSALAEADPVLCLIDDAQWIDAESAGVLRFVARRVETFRIGLVFAMSGDQGRVIDGAERMRLDGLGLADAQALLKSVYSSPLDSRVEMRILAEARGNPGALLTLASGLCSSEFAGGFGVSPAPASLPGASAISGRVAELDPEERRLITIAAADPTGDPTLLRAAAERRGLAPDALLSDRVAPLLEVGHRVAFRHPLLRTAAYALATPEERRDAHHALADALAPSADPDWRAWHRALAAEGPDEELASQLEDAAPLAQTRGGLAAAAAFWTRATELSADTTQRGRRALVAAELRHRAGDSETALRVLAAAEPALADAEQREHAELLRARAAYAMSRDGGVPAPLRHAAAKMTALDRGLARDSHLEALSALPPLPRATGRAAESFAEAPGGPPAVTALLDALAALDREGVAAGGPAVAAALTQYRTGSLSDEDALAWDWLACRAAACVWDFESMDALSARMVRLPRALGFLRALPLGLSYRMVTLVLGGELNAASRLGVELDAIAPARDAMPLAAGDLCVHAWRGRDDQSTSLIDLVRERSTGSGQPAGVAAGAMARAVLWNGLGRHDLAFDAAYQGSRMPEGMFFQNLCLPELVEAAVRCRRREVAEWALRVLRERTEPATGGWAHGVELHSRALLAGDAAEPLHRESIRVLAETRVRTEHARSMLVFGEWLRRRRRRAEARAQLRSAHAMFVEMGMEGFALRAARELAAAGDTANPPSADPAVPLTPRELEVARLAGAGLSNPEIGVRLFLSARTVQYHLRKVFMKLQISSRVQLAEVLGGLSVGDAGRMHRTAQAS